MFGYMHTTLTPRTPPTHTHTYTHTHTPDAVVLQQLFDTPYFRVDCVANVQGVELFGALKNVVAIAAGV
jgi:glycerol-3-phosphate dehydrogenase (NAD+)